jgi:ring-1,2-phenylacetyl-CoA epoxidase subunit PaaC
LLDGLEQCSDPRLAAIAARAVKEVRYHLRHGSQWLIRLGDGTEESHARVQQSLDALWRFTGEMFVADELDDTVRSAFGGPDLETLAGVWHSHVESILQEATLQVPADTVMASGGKEGRHSESFGYLLAEMQHLQRAYPGASW